MRLGGWHRIGIVLSVLWAVGAGWYQRTADVRHAADLDQLTYKGEELWIDNRFGQGRITV